MVIDFPHLELILGLEGFAIIVVERATTSSLLVLVIPQEPRPTSQWVISPVKVRTAAGVVLIEGDWARITAPGVAVGAISIQVDVVYIFQQPAGFGAAATRATMLRAMVKIEVLEKRVIV